MSEGRPPEGEEPPPLPYRKRPGRSWISTALSAFVCPGAGQLAQKRWAAGLFYMTLFVAAAGFLVFHMVAAIVYQYRYYLGSEAPAGDPPWFKLLVSALAAVAIYVLSLADTWAAGRKRHA